MLGVSLLWLVEAPSSCFLWGFFGGHVSPFCSSEEGGFLVSTIYLFSQPQSTQKFISKLLVDTSAKHKFINETNLCLRFFFFTLRAYDFKTKFASFLGYC